MKKISFELKVLTLVLALAFILRFFNLSNYPAFNADEAAIGYNAYSLILTGLDEHGHTWPVHFQSFNDWKPGMYFYLVIPFVKLLGLNELAVRIPNAALGVLTVYFVYLLSNLIFDARKINLGKYTVEIGFVSSLFLAISPWHIHFSRGGWEVGTATFFMTSGFYYFLRSVKNNLSLKPMLVSVFLLVMSFYTYHAARVIVPLLTVVGILIYKNDIFSKINIKNIVYVILFGFVLILPLTKDLISGDALSRAAGVGLFADKGPINRINEQRGEHQNVSGIFTRVEHNKAVNYALAFLRNWSMHYQGEFLFMTGDGIQRNKVPETGQMYLADIVFLALGLILLTTLLKKETVFLLSWLIIAPVAAALTFQAPHALRAENMVIPLVLISSLGFFSLLEKKNRYFIILTSIFLVWCFVRYLHMYYIHMSKDFPYSSQYGLKELSEYIITNQDKYKDIVVTDRYDQPYILFLFYSKYTPKLFQFKHSLSSRDDFGFSTVRDFDKYHFVSIDFESIKNNYPQSLIVGTKDEIPKEANVIKKIYGTNGFEYFNLVAN